MPWIIGGAAVGSALLGASAARDASGKQSEATGKAVDATERQYNQTRADLAPYRQAGSAALSRLRSLLGIPDVQATGGAINYGGQQFDNIDHLRQALIDDYVSKGGNPNSQEYQNSLQAVLDKATPVEGAGGGEGGSSPLLRKFASSDLAADPVYNSGLQFGLDEGTKAIERRAAAGGSYDSGATLKALTRFGNDYGSTKAGESYGRFRDFQDTAYNKLAGIAGMGSGATSVGVGANTATGSNLASLYTGQGNADAAASIARTNAITGAGNNAMGYYYLNKLSGAGQRTPIDYSTAGS